ncbi:methyltransferase, TIGR04325 family [Ruegeria marina]|uniref:Putative methyltransferase, LIC12133 family n=1 Tax=Ruegeria marina TaxID=639004 RepID=A0A1G6IDL8_9RHOB|nr:methyltransferase, TIGR04325 family [Ruegeria marina]SDC04095.1 putative methyltransferase, LIC12133 family [Ruegeria marina]
MSIRSIAKALLGTLKRRIGWPVSALWARIMALGIRPPAFIGAYPDRNTAVAQVSKGTPSSYDNDKIAPLNFELMSETHIWDYPIMFWLERLMQPGLNVLDAGGHFGTKFIAFRDRIDLGQVDWNVYDVPATIRAALRLQQSGKVPDQIKFFDDLSKAQAPDVLLASGLLQYLDIGFHELVDSLPSPPKHILLNKVATTNGPTVVTLEKIGSGRIPYQIRNRAEFEHGIAAMGYRIRDSWHIPSLARTIATHPSLGASTSRGYVLERAE